MNRDFILTQLKEILRRQNKSVDFTEDADLREIGFRSLDFSELALRLEMSVPGKPKEFDAAPLRSIRTVKDVLDTMQVLYGHHEKSASF